MEREPERQEYEKEKSVVKEPPDDERDGKVIQASNRSGPKPLDAPTDAATGSAPLDDVEEQTPDLKKKLDKKPPAADDPIGGKEAPGDLQNLNSV
jgi:hypothetical protein